MSWALEQLRELRARRRGDATPSAEPCPRTGWRDELTGAERRHSPEDLEPSEDFMRAILGARDLFGGELFSLDWRSREQGVQREDLPEEWREWYEERAAIREHDGGQAREHAEAEALRETIAAMRRRYLVNPKLHHPHRERIDKTDKSERAQDVG